MFSLFSLDSGITIFQLDIFQLALSSGNRFGTESLTRVGQTIHISLTKSGIHRQVQHESWVTLQTSNYVFHHRKAEPKWTTWLEVDGKIKVVTGVRLLDQHGVRYTDICPVLRTLSFENHGRTVRRPLGPAIFRTKPNDLLQFDYIAIHQGSNGEKYILTLRDDHSNSCWL